MRMWRSSLSDFPAGRGCVRFEKQGKQGQGDDFSCRNLRYDIWSQEANRPIPKVYRITRIMVEILPIAVACAR